MLKNKNMRNLIFEEMINTAIHAFGVVLSIIGFGVLLYFSLLSKNNFAIIASLIYGTSLVLLYTASTLLHGNLSRKNEKHIYSLFDYCAIYLLIAGTYTPFILLTLWGKSGYLILFMIWGLALMGIIYQVFFNLKYQLFSTVSYVLMGWVIVLEIKNMINSIPYNGLLLLILGGLSYTLGSVFFFFSDKNRFNHAIWHVFVLLGSVLHYFSVLFYVMPFKLLST